MDKNLTFVLGGARSGKSTFARQMAETQSQNVTFVATATVTDGEMSARIAAHRAERLPHWKTIEAPLQAGKAILDQAAQPEIVLLDCMAVLISNIILTLPENSSEVEAQHAVNAELETLLVAYRAGNARWIIVSNEVGLGVIPAYPLGRLYRDVLGRSNQYLAQQADQVYFLVSGIPMKIK